MIGPDGQDLMSATVNLDDSSNPNGRKCITRASSKCRLRWDIFVILLAIYNSFAIPMNIAFNIE